MLKQKKNLNIKNKFKKVRNKFGEPNKLISKLRRVFRNKPYFLNSNFQEILKTQNSFALSKKLDIRITPNNVFCTLKNLSNNKIIKVGSSGKYKIKTSKKTLKFSCKVIVGFFLDEIKQDLVAKTLLINLTGPIRLRKVILEQVVKHIRKSSVTINVNNKKCFNGCRPKKKRRKKQKGLRLFK